MVFIPFVKNTPLLDYFEDWVIYTFNWLCLLGIGITLPIIVYKFLKNKI